jgi:S-adenosylmethionine hydrolase
MKPICFISDYGLTGVLVGTCKGVMADIAPRSPVIDVTHSVLAFDVVRGAETMRHATRYMPEDAVYLAVIDPGDKTRRRALALEVQSGSFLVGPDNGLLLPAADALGGIVRAVHLTNPRYHMQPVSNTFHGRDVFSPVAAHLAAGADLDDLGERVPPESLISIDFPGFRWESGGVISAKIICRRIWISGTARPWRSASGTRFWTLGTWRPSGPRRQGTSSLFPTLTGA